MAKFIHLKVSINSTESEVSFNPDYVRTIESISYDETKSYIVTSTNERYLSSLSVKEATELFSSH